MTQNIAPRAGNDANCWKTAMNGGNASAASRHIENRVPGVDVDPYLAMARDQLLGAGTPDAAGLMPIQGPKFGVRAHFR
jgi:hypothetical protein